MNHYRRALVEAARRLAISADQQECYLTQLGVGVDEIALEFDDLFRLAATKLDAGAIAAREYDVLCVLERALQEISGPKRADLWTVEALRGRSEWAKIRELANDAIATMTGERRGPSP